MHNNWKLAKMILVDRNGHTFPYSYILDSAKGTYTKHKPWKEVLINATIHLTHWGRVTHICVGKLTIIGSDNGLSPGRRQAIIWTNAGILLTEPLGTNFSEVLIGIQIFSYTKMRLKMSSVKWRPFYLGLNVLNYLITQPLFFSKCPRITGHSSHVNARNGVFSVIHNLIRIFMCHFHIAINKFFISGRDIRSLCCICIYRINTLRQKQNGRHFPDDIFKRIFSNKDVWFSIKIS